MKVKVCGWWICKAWTVTEAAIQVQKGLAPSHIIITFDVNYIIKEPNGFHVQEVAYASSTDLQRGRRREWQPSPAVAAFRPNTGISACAHNATHCSHPEGVPVIKLQVQVSLSPQVLLDLSTELAQDVLQRGGGEGEGHIHTTSHESHASDVGGLCDASSCTECHCDSSLYLFQCGRDLLVEEGQHVFGRLLMGRPPHDSRTVPHGREHILK